MKIASVVGARPNFVKMAPIHKAISTISNHIIIHTGQHYDYELSEIFFNEFNLPAPTIDLEVGSGPPGFQIGKMLEGLEKIFLESHFDLIIVYGDTNSTFAGALSAMKSGIKVAHVEAGLRSFDRRMPEEINRILTDQLSDYLFAPTATAIENLEKEHVAGKVVYTGDISVEIMEQAVRLASKSSILEKLHLESKSYLLLTMHRVENTDSEYNLKSIIRALETLDEIVVFPIHPRTKKMLEEKHLFDRLEKCKNVRLIPPTGYIDFIKLMQNARKIITDSGGIQKESYLLAVPCITIRNNTEWVETVDAGWNKIVGTDTSKIIETVKGWTPTNPNKPIFGNGQTSAIIKELILSLMEK